MFTPTNAQNNVPLGIRYQAVARDDEGKPMIKRDIVAKMQIVQMDKETLIEFRKTAKSYVDQLKAKYPDVKKIVESQEKFVEEFSVWRGARGGVSPWPYEDYISGKIYE